MAAKRGYNCTSHEIHALGSTTVQSVNCWWKAASGLRAEWTPPPIWVLCRNGTTIPQPSRSTLVCIPSGVFWLRIARYHLFPSAFAKHFQKATIRLIMSIRPSFCMENGDYHRTGFPLNTLFGISGKVCRHTPILVEKGHTARTPTYVYDI